MTPSQRAFIATYLFAVTGLWSVLFHTSATQYLIPHTIFYAVLTLNTFFSVRFYSSFTPPSYAQSTIDLALVAVYVALGLSIGMPLSFAFCALAVFTIAPVKYAHMLGKTTFDATLRKKILIDLLGLVLCVAVLGLTIMHQEMFAAWMLAGLFTAANVYLLVLRPMYRHVE